MDLKREDAADAGIRGPLDFLRHVELLNCPSALKSLSAELRAWGSWTPWKVAGSGFAWSTALQPILAVGQAATARAA